MEILNSKNFSILLHTDWHPGKGDSVKENSIIDSALFNKRIRIHKILTISLTVSIIVIFISAIIFIS